MAGGGATGGTVQTDTYAGARGWLLLPAWLTLGILTLAPLAIMLVYSFLTKEFRGGVIWE
ncbi:ABC transporter permease, partial [Cribrihabitans sp. XS_ASV171]